MKHANFAITDPNSKQDKAKASLRQIKLRCRAEPQLGRYVNRVYLEWTIRGKHHRVNCIGTSRDRQRHFEPNLHLRISSARYNVYEQSHRPTYICAAWRQTIGARLAGRYSCQTRPLIGAARRHQPIGVRRRRVDTPQVDELLADTVLSCCIGMLRPVMGKSKIEYLSQIRTM